MRGPGRPGRLIEDGATFFTSNYVFAETYTALMVGSGGEAIEWGRRFRAGEASTWFALTTVSKRRLGRSSKITATSDGATSMRPPSLSGAREASEAFAFDVHFAQRGLQVLPDTAAFK